jgi:epoxyqueuosine reductase
VVGFFNILDMYHNLSHIASQIGFADFGAAPIKSLTQHTQRLKTYLEHNYNAGMSYLEKNIDKRDNPALLLGDDCSNGTIFCFVVPYSRAVDGTPVASFALGIDYHSVIKQRLRIFCSQIPLNSVHFRVFTDSAPIFERAWAVECGLGFWGCNNFFISEKVGLRCLLGIIITDIDYSLIDCEELRIKKASVKTDCGHCGNCISKCPTGALVKPFCIDARKCISYLTIEDKTLYSEKPISFEKNIFGCEACLRACPWDKEADVWPELIENKDLIEGMSIADWQSLTEQEWLKYFKDSSLSRCGLKKIKNNC